MPRLTKLYLCNLQYPFPWFADVSFAYTHIIEDLQLKPWYSL